MISRADAVSILASEQGIDLFEYLESEEVERIRAIVTKSSAVIVDRTDHSKPFSKRKKKQPSRKTAEYIQTDGLHGYIKKLAIAVNKAAASRSFVCVEVLSRKILENLVIDILLKSKGPSTIWKDSSANIKHNLSTLLNTFWDLVDTEFKPYLHNYDKAALSKLQSISWKIKNLGDAGSHTVRLDTSEDSIMKRQRKLQDLVDFLVRLLDLLPNDAKRKT